MIENKVTCDMCGTFVVLDSPDQVKAQTNGRYWSMISMSGTGYDKANARVSVLSKSKDICPTCIDRIGLPKKPETKKLTVMDSLEDAMRDWLEDMAIDVIENVLENR